MTGGGTRLRRDNLNRWLPGALPYGGQITVGETAQPPQRDPGVPQRDRRAVRNAAWLLAVALVARQLLALVSAEPPLFPPGTRWAYSNTDCILLGMIIQLVTGHSPAQEI